MFCDFFEYGGGSCSTGVSTNPWIVKHYQTNYFRTLSGKVSNERCRITTGFVTALKILSRGTRLAGDADAFNEGCCPGAALNHSFEEPRQRCGSLRRYDPSKDLGLLLIKNFSGSCHNLFDERRPHENSLVCHSGVC